MTRFAVAGRARIAAVLGVAMLGVAAAAPLGINLGFEETREVRGHMQPAEWYTGGEGYDVVIDTTERVEGQASLRSRYTTPGAWTGGRFGVATQSMRPGSAAGRALRLSGWIRTEAVSEGYAGLWLRVDGPDGRSLAFDNMSTRGAKGTTGWTRYEITLPVDSAALSIVFGALHPGSGTAWFDSLDLQVVGPARAREPLPPAPPKYAPPPRPAEDLTRLLSDAELAIPPDSVPATEPADVTAWVRAHAHPIRSLGANEFADLRFLAPLLRDKRIVQLGENGHGVREFNLAKVRLIKYLHEELGYDVIAFESSLYECDRAGRMADSLDAVALMQNCIFGVWHTEEVVPLFEYVKQTRATAHPLVLTGFDTQRSSGGARRRPAFLRSVVEALDSAYAERVWRVDLGFLNRPMGDGTIPRAAGDSLAPVYDSLAMWIDAHRGELARHFRNDPTAPALARQTARSMSAFARQLAAGDGTARTEIRDRGMADNLDFLLDELYPGKKVLVWAHNYHIQHRGFGGAPGNDTGAPRTMGTWVAERHRKELYTVGLYMYRGSAAMNNQAFYPIRPATAGSLESILHQAPWRHLFVDFSRVKRERGSEWMFAPITAREWGTAPQRLVPHDEYDGVLFVDRTWPPAYGYGRRGAP